MNFIIPTKIASMKTKALLPIKLNSFGFSYLLIVITIPLFLITRNIASLSYDFYIWQVTFIMGIALLGIKNTYNENTPAFSIIIRATTFIALFSLILRYKYFDAFVPIKSDLSAFLMMIVELVVIIVGILGIRSRPSLTIVPIYYFVLKKELFFQHTNIKSDYADWSIVMDVGIFILLALIIKNIAFILLSKTSLLKTSALFKDNETTKKSSSSKLQILDIIVLFAIALHFSNYFYSGLEKVLIGRGLFYWAFQNHTYNLILAANEMSAYPLAFSESLAHFVLKLMKTIFIPLNLFVLFIQLIAIIAITRIKWIIIITLLYDLMHISIFLVTGIFFWKWIIFNLAVVFALRHLKDVILSRKVKTLLVITVIVAPLICNIMLLAWIDTPSVEVTKVYAVDDQNIEYEIPYSYFLSEITLKLSQHRFVKNSADYSDQGHYKGVMSMGAISTRGKHEIANNCKLPTGEESKYHESFADGNIERVVKNYHNYVLSKANDKGVYNYHIYPFHFGSITNFYKFKDFYYLDKRKVKKYKFVLESLCLGYDNGQYTKDIRLKGSHEIKL